MHSRHLLIVFRYFPNIAAGCSNEGVQCAMQCEFGFQRDKNGCEVCACVERLCMVSQNLVRVQGLGPVLFKFENAKSCPMEPILQTMVLLHGVQFLFKF